MTYRMSLAAGIVSPLYEAGLDVELLPSGGANQSSLLREVNQVMTGKALVVPEPYARQLFDLPRVPLDVPPPARVRRHQGGRRARGRPVPKVRRARVALTPIARPAAQGHNAKRWVLEAADHTPMLPRAHETPIDRFDG